MVFLSNLKNTVLLLVLVLSGCGNKIQTVKTVAETNSIKSKITPTPKIIVGANRTDLYIPLLKDKKVAIVTNQTSVIFKETTTKKIRRQ